jgi:hypothetical protein
MTRLDEPAGGHGVGSMGRRYTPPPVASSRGARWLNLRTLLWGVSLATLGVLWSKGATHALANDEIWTAEVAGLSSPVAVVGALLEGRDTHQPIDYLLRHAGMAAFGRGELAVRWLSVPILLVGCFAIRSYLRRFVSPAAATVGFLVPFTTIALNHALEARPYVLVFTGMAAALWGWGRLKDRPSLGNAVLLAAILGGNVLVHPYGALAFSPVFAGAVLSSLRARSVDARHVVAVAGGLAIACAAVPFVLVARSLGLDHPPKGDFSPVSLFLHMAGNGPMTALLAVVGYLLGSRARRFSVEDGSVSPAPLEEVLVVLTVVAVPALVFALSFFTGLSAVRYTVGGVAGLACLAGIAVDCVPSRVALSRGAALAACVVMTAYGLAASRNPSGPPLLSKREADARELAAWLRGVEGPVVLSEQRLFLESYTYLPADAKPRVVFPVWPEQARRFFGHDAGDVTLPRLAPINGMRVPPLQDFLASNPRFLLVDAGGWISSYVLSEPGFTARRVGTVLGRRVWEIRRAA